jgi:DNA-binding response OmpR family regulator
MATLLLLTRALGPSSDVLPALGLLGHPVRVAAPEVSALLDAPATDAVLVDARRDLVQARQLCRLLRTTGLSAPLFAVLTEGGLIALTAEWGVDDVLLDSAGPGEVDARLRLATGRVSAGVPDAEPGVVRAGELTIDEGTYTCRLRGRALDLTFKEFELLKHLAGHPGRVFTRAQLLQEVWGYDYYGGTRTVDVHVRRLRAKLGAEHEQLIGTVRHVGYKFVTPPVEVLGRESGGSRVSGGGRDDEEPSRRLLAGDRG